MKLRDNRNPGWFWAENELFDVFQPLIGVNGVVVYMAISRMLCDPRWRDARLSLREIADKSGRSKDTVSRSIADMVALGMILEKDHGPNTKSSYALLDLKEAALCGHEELERRLTHSANNQRPTRDRASLTPKQTVAEMKVATVSTVSPRDSLRENPQCLRGSPANETVSPRDSLSVGETVFETDLSQNRDQPALFKNLNLNGERELTGAREAGYKVLDLPALAGLVVVAHPRAQLRNWTLADVQVSDREAVLEAAHAEAQLVAGSPEDAAVGLLEKVRTIAREVPRSHWRFLKDVAPFMRLREYRMKPADLYRSNAETAERATRPEARIGVVRTSDAPKPHAQESTREKALDYWRAVRGTSRYRAECPAWARELIEREGPSAA